MSSSPLLEESAPAVHDGLAGLSLAAERRMLALLAVIQFTNIVDFMIIMPLGPQFMEALQIGTAEFGNVVSAYGYAAGATGLFAALFIDRFPRKSALMWIVAGFGVGTLLCGLAPTYPLLVAARVVAGAFGGVIGGLALTMIGDAIPPARRGAATGILMLGFSAASVMGVPLGLFLATHFGWQSPFVMLASLTIVVVAAAQLWLPVLPPGVRDERHAAHALWATICDPDHLRAFALMAGLMFAGFAVIPFLSPYLVGHVGLTNRQLPFVYLFGGVSTLISVPLIGWLADRFGKLRVFLFMAVASLAPILELTRLPQVPVYEALAVTTLFMICTSGRAVPAMALIVGSADPSRRASFMSVNSSVQQISMGLATSMGALILGEEKDWSRFAWVGIAAAAFTVVCLPLASRLRAAKREDAALRPEVLPELGAPEII